MIIYSVGGGGREEEEGRTSLGAKKREGRWPFGGPNISWRQEERGKVCVGIR